MDVSEMCESIPEQCVLLSTVGQILWAERPLSQEEANNTTAAAQEARLQFDLDFWKHVLCLIKLKLKKHFKIL